MTIVNNENAGISILEVLVALTLCAAMLQSIQASQSSLVDLLQAIEMKAELLTQLKNKANTSSKDQNCETTAINEIGMHKRSCKEDDLLGINIKLIPQE